MPPELSLARFQAALRNSAVQAVGFDVFDTLVTRTFARPTDLFLPLGADLRAAGLWPADPLRFRLARATAEDTARAAHPAAEPTLAAIYEVLAGTAGWSPSQTAAALARELAHEHAALVAVPALVAWVEAARAAGLPVAFVSDMYLPATFIAERLGDLGVARPGEAVLVSCEAGASKHTGTLFPHVAAHFGLPPARILHVGDNPRSDHRVPAALGFPTLPVAPVRARPPLEPFAAEADSADILPGRLAAAARLAPATIDTAEPALAAIGAGLLGPLLTTYVLWLFAEAHRRGLRRLYFIARDGQVMLELARRIQARLGPAAPLELRYLHGSRIAWHRTTLDTFTPRHLRWLLEPQPRVDAATLADRLGLPAADLLAALAPHLPSPLLDQGRSWSETDLPVVAVALRAAEAVLLARPELARRRAAGRRYLQEQGLLEPVPWAVVELGWSGRMMVSLHAALGGERPFTAFFLGLHQVAPDAPLALEFAAFLRQPGEVAPPEFHGLRLAEMLEVLTAADHATTLGYEEREGQARPVLKADATPVWPAPALAALRAGARAFVDSLAPDALQDLAATVAEPQGARRLAAALRRTLATFIANPPAELARPFAACRFTEDSSDRLARPFVAPLHLRGFRAALRSALWPQGSLALASPLVRDLATAGKSAAATRTARRFLAALRRPAPAERA